MWVPKAFWPLVRWSPCRSRREPKATASEWTRGMLLSSRREELDLRPLTLAVPLFDVTECWHWFVDLRSREMQCSRSKSERQSDRVWPEKPQYERLSSGAPLGLQHRAVLEPGRASSAVTQLGWIEVSKIGQPFRFPSSPAEPLPVKDHPPGGLLGSALLVHV